MTRLESQSMTRVRVIFAKSQPLIDKPSLFAYKEMIKIAANFLLWLSSRVILYPKGQVFITCTVVDLRFIFYWGARRAQYRPIDTSSWSNQVFAILAVGHVLLLWVFSRWSDLSYLSTNPMQKYTAQYNAYPNSCHCY